jgi:hypothetical protein
VIHPEKLLDFVSNPFEVVDTSQQQLYSEDQPRDEAGKWTDGGGASTYATNPRVFNRPEQIQPFTSWGETKFGWVDEKGEQTGRLLTGKVVDPATLPQYLYHVTTNAPAVESSGVLLGQLNQAGGLGGGQAEGVSFTLSPVDARVIQRDLTRGVQIARGEGIDAGMFAKWAAEDEKEAHVPPGTLNGAVEQAMRQWNGNLFTLDRPDYDTGLPKTPEQRDKTLRSLAHDAFNAYLWGRQSAGRDVGLLKNPVLAGQREALAKIDPKNIRILRVPSANIPKGALITTGSDDFLHEIRTYADVPAKGTRKKASALVWITYVPDSDRQTLEATPPKGGPP